MTEKKDILLSILFGVVTGLAAVGLFASSGYLISKAALAPPLYTLTIVIASVKLLGMTRAFSRYGERYFSHRATFSLLSHIRVYFYKRLEPLAATIFQRYRSGDLLARIVGDVETLQNFFLRVLYPPIVLVIVFLSTIFFTAYFSVAIAFILLIGMVLTSFVIPVFFAWRQRKVDQHVRKSRGNLSTEVTEFLYGFRDLKLYQQLGQKKKQLMRMSDGYIQEQEKESTQHILGESVNQLVSFLVSWFVIALGAFYVAEGQLDGIFLAMLVMISLTVFENTGAMAVLPSHLEDSRQAATRLFSVVEKEPLQEGVDEREERKSIFADGEGIEVKMENVSFSYPNDPRPTIDHVSVTIPPGSKTAIVGPSGSGKSTLLYLLLQMYSPTEGAIFFNKQNIDRIQEETLWSHTNVVLQKNHFFYGTVRENLLLANERASDDEMKRILNKVELEYVGLDDAVLEKGENLSGGEKQRLAIARVLLRKASLWLLDEPTSSIDAVTEQTVFQHFREAANENTLVLVSHRLTSLEQMDQIIVMEQGRIVEQGSYKTLMTKKGYLYELKQIEKDVFTM